MHRCEITGLSGRERKHPGVFDQEQVVLLEVEAKPVGRQRAVAEAADEGMFALAAPDFRAFRAKFLRQCRTRHRTFTCWYYLRSD